jgi:hypothetical protein
MATKTAPKTAAKKPAPKAPAKATTPKKPEPVLFNLEEMARRIAKVGMIYHKISPFDHEAVALTSYYMIWDNGECTMGLAFQTYNGKLTGYQADAVLNLTGGVAIDLPATLRRLDKKGYQAVTVAPSKSRKKGGK